MAGLKVRKVYQFPVSAYYTSDTAVGNEQSSATIPSICMHGKVLGL